jgi:hypothetical protein
MESRYRGYQLHPVATHRGWGVVLEDPAGHVADLCLHRQLGHGGWQRLEDAEQAAHEAIDALLTHDDSY